MNINFCAQCGNLFTYKKIVDEGEQKYCECCNKFYLDNPANCIEILKKKVLICDIKKTV